MEDAQNVTLIEGHWYLIERDRKEGGPEIDFNYKEIGASIKNLRTNLGYPKKVEITYEYS